jgi:competence protein ComEC
VFLTPKQWIPLPANYTNPFKKFLFTTREKMVALLQKYIEGNVESGLAEALLIGYKDDQDKQLVQAYSNTGVVHVIAISGLHLGLIYWLLNFLLQPLSKRKKSKWVKPLLIIAVLWLFSLLAGGSPSVLRSAVMFTCIVLGESQDRKISVYNSLAASAFLLLCYNPFWIWDAGFQLSYVAVLSIVVFSKPVYNLLYIPNKLLDHGWKLISVTIAAQILTTPISIYYFHQFPIVFLVTNLVAIPLSSIILLGEIILCAFSFLPNLATGIGWIIHHLIRLLNHFIEYIDKLPFAVWTNLSISIAQSLFFYGTIIAMSYWLMQKNKKALIWSLSGVFCFIILRTVSFSRALDQRKIIIYNIPRHRAIDFINGRNYYFEGDSALVHDDYLQNFHLKPSRVLHRINRSDSLIGLLGNHNYFIFGDTRILLVDKNLRLSSTTQKLIPDIIIVSGNPKLYIKDLLAVTECKQVVIDGSNPTWKVNQWKKDCAVAGIACHIVSVNGAFVMNLP